MSLILSGTDGLSDVDGSAATPAIRGTDSNTGIFFPAADTIAFAEGGVEVARFDASGNLGIGTSLPGARLDTSLSSTASGLAGVIANPQFSITNPANWGYPTGMLFRAPLAVNGSVLNNASIWSEFQTTNQAYLGFATYGAGALTERARIDSSGRLLVGATSVAFSARLESDGADGGAGAFITNSADSARAIQCWNKASSGNRMVAFYTGSGATFAGGIESSGSTTTYGTSSDYRLKEDIQPMTGALAKVADLKPVTYKWKSNNTDGEGFIAHELAEVCPHSVRGTKDGVDADGKPDYQTVDTSFLVATLTAAIQEQQVLIQEIKAELAALKGAA
jgi:hypothetical protein